MITFMIDYDTVKNDYPDKSDELIETLRTSKSKYNNTDIEDIKWSYSFSYFLKKGDCGPEYYEKLVNMNFDERYEKEIEKVRVNIVMAAGFFYLSDRVDGVSESIKNIVKLVTIQKMLAEQSMFNNIEVINSIPHQENEMIPMSLDDQLKHALEIEDYMEAARLRDVINLSKN